MASQELDPLSKVQQPKSGFLERIPDIYIVLALIVFAVCAAGYAITRP